MKAIIAAEACGPDGLTLSDIPTPEPRRGEVRIRVSTCGVNFADLLLIRGQYQTKPPFPIIPGMEAVGRIDALGEGVEGFQVGQRVAAMCGLGGMAEAVCAPASLCAALPDAIDDVSAAALVIAYGTSELALRDRAGLRRGETLLVTGAGGGIGLTAVEIGSLMGAYVIAAARGVDKLAIAAEAGADRLINLESEDLRERVRALTGGAGADVIYDPVGGDVFKAALRAAAFEARILPVGFASGEVPQIPANILLVKNVSVIGFWWGAYFEKRPEAATESLRRVFAWAESGEIAPHISHVLKLKDGAAALQLLKDRRAAGKVVVTIE